MDTLQMRPLDDRVLIQLDPVAEKVGSIYIPNPDSRRSRTGEVKAVGPGHLLDNGKRAPMELKEGDKVMLGPVTGGRELEEEGTKFVLMRERDVLAVAG